MIKDMLLWLRKIEGKKTYIINGIILFIGIVLAFICDIFKVYTILKSLCILVIAVPLFILLYYIIISYTSKVDKKKTIKGQLTRNQRINISLLVGTVLVLLQSILLRNSIFYTFTAGINIAIILLLILFCRRTRDEGVQEEYGIF